MAGKKFTLAVLILLVAVSASAQSPFGGGGPPPVCAPSEGGNPMCQASLTWPPLKPLSPGGPPGGEIQDLPPASGAGTGGMPVVDENLFFGGGSTGGHGAGGSWGFTTTYGNGWSAINTSSYGEGGWTGGVGYIGSNATSDLNNAKNAWDKFGGIAAAVGRPSISELFPAGGFAPQDFVMGLTEHPEKEGLLLLQKFQREVGKGGGSTMAQIMPWDTADIVPYIMNKLETMAPDAKIHFNLDAIKFPQALIKENWRYGGTVTAKELQWIRANWLGKVGPWNVIFYRDGQALARWFAPW